VTGFGRTIPGVGLFYRVCQNSGFALSRLLWGIRVEGRENVPLEGALLVTANHRSVLDPPLVGASFPREAGFAAKRELFEVPGFGALIRGLNAIPVDRANLAPSTLRRFEDWLKRGNALIVFPEGTRSKDGRLGEPRVGVGMVLARMSVPVLPVWVEGTESPVRNLFRRGRVRVVFGRPYTLPNEGTSSSGERERFRDAARIVLDAIRRLGDENGPGRGRRSTRHEDAPPRERPAVPPIMLRIQDEGMESIHDAG
jgi:1-acyl-sn-glycerol-3-phosphate acyltransferase